MPPAERVPDRLPSTQPARHAGYDPYSAASYYGAGYDYYSSAAAYGAAAGAAAKAAADSVPLPPPPAKALAALAAAQEAAKAAKEGGESEDAEKKKEEVSWRVLGCSPVHVRPQAGRRVCLPCCASCAAGCVSSVCHPSSQPPRALFPCWLPGRPAPPLPLPTLALAGAPQCCAGAPAEGRQAGRGRPWQGLPCNSQTAWTGGAGRGSGSGRPQAGRCLCCQACCPCRQACSAPNKACCTSRERTSATGQCAWTHQGRPEGAVPAAVH